MVEMLAVLGNVNRLNVLWCTAKESVGSHLTIYSTRSSAVAEKPRDTSCHWIYCCHSMSFEMTRLRGACVSPYQCSI